MKDLSGDRKIEWGFVKEWLPRSGGARLLEIGPSPPNAPLCAYAASLGYSVTGVGLEPVGAVRGLRYLQSDFRRALLLTQFQWVLNISTIEHFGIAGRYGVETDEENADLEGMRRAREVMEPGGIQLLTIPVGKDAIVRGMHRVYGKIRLPHLLHGYHVLRSEFWLKNDDNLWLSGVHSSAALNETPTADPYYYALGAFILRRP